MLTTTNYGLNKIELTDSPDITVINKNWDLLDEKIKTLTDGKVDSMLGKGLSTNDFTTDEKTKLGKIEDGANKYVHPNTHSSTIITGLSNVATSGSYVDLINIPTEFMPSTHTHDISQMTGLPTSLPASDVYDWAKQSTKPAYSASEVGALALDGKAASSSTADSATKATYASDGTTDILAEITSLKSSVSNGKQEIATAITGKGISASGSDSFAQLSTKISNISTGVDTSDATAIASDLLTGKTAYVGGGKVSGSMINRGSVDYTLTIPSDTYVVPQGYHNGTGIVKCWGELVHPNTAKKKMVNMLYYTFHYAFDSSAVMANEEIANEMLYGTTVSSYVKETIITSTTTIFLEGDQFLFIKGGGSVSSHSGSVADECGSYNHRGYLFYNTGDSYSVTINPNGNSYVSYYILNYK